MSSPILTRTALRRETKRTLRSVLDPAGWGRFTGRVLRERNLYGALAFAETAESMRLCQEALQVGPGDRLAGICSSGDMLLSLLSEGADEVVGFDVNPTQVALAQLKRATIANLSVSEYLELFGVAPASARWRLRTFDRITRALDANTRRHLLQRRGWVGRGILNHGMTHLIIRAMSAAVEQLVPAETNALFLGDHGTDRQRAERLNQLIDRPVTRYGVAPFTRKFAPALKWLFFPHKICRVSTRPDEMVAEFFETFRPLFERGAKANPVLARSATGHLHEEWSDHLYDSARFETITARTDRLRFEHYDLTAGLATLPTGWATKLYLSNAPDYLTDAELQALVREIRRVSAPGARILHFSLLDEDRVGDRIGDEAPEMSTLRASDNVHLYPAIVLRIAAS